MQTGGAESSTCWPTECSLKFYTASTTVISDKYSVNGTQTFSYQKFCIAGADEIKAHSEGQHVFDSVPFVCNFNLTSPFEPREMLSSPHADARSEVVVTRGGIVVTEII